LDCHDDCIPDGTRKIEGIRQQQGALACAQAPGRCPVLFLLKRFHKSFIIENS